MGIEAKVKLDRIAEIIRTAKTAFESVTTPTWEQAMALDALGEAEMWARKAAEFDERETQHVELLAGTNAALDRLTVRKPA